MAKSSNRGATRRQAPKKKRQLQQKQLPGWIWLVAGLAMGLFVAFLMHLGQLQKQSDGADLVAPAQPKTKKETTKMQKPKSNLPQFDFYAVLPKMEVVLPKSEQKPESRSQSKKTRSHKATPSTEAQTHKTQPVAAADDKGEFLLQAGSFKSQASAEKLRAEFTLQGFSVSVQPGTLSNGETWYRVMVGPFGDRGAMRHAQDKLAANNVDTLPIQVTKP